MKYIFFDNDEQFLLQGILQSKEDIRSKRELIEIIKGNMLDNDEEVTKNIINKLLLLDEEDIMHCIRHYNNIPLSFIVVG